jgi:predicted TIM-barrel fold metal-dependent hydrolase
MSAAASFVPFAEPLGYGIWDAHVHPITPGATPYERMANIVRVADRWGIERMCIFKALRPFNAIASPSPDQLRRMNDEILAILRDWSSRAFGFVYLNPLHLEFSLHELERCVANGPMVGVKLWVACPCSRPELDPIVARAAELKAVILQHAWTDAAPTELDRNQSSPADVVQLSARHPGVPIICAHTGGNWEPGIRTIRPRREIFSEFGGSEPTAGFVEMAVRELGAERIVYGTDAPGRDFASQLSKIQSAAITAAERRLILRDNLRKLLLPILRSKGIDA